MGKWINASKRHPKLHHKILENDDEIIKFDMSDEVLALTKSGEMIIAWYEESYKGKTKVWADGGESSYDVTHWMHLPKPPKEV